MLYNNCRHSHDYKDFPTLRQKNDGEGIHLNSNIHTLLQDSNPIPSAFRNGNRYEHIRSQSTLTT